MDSIWPSVLEQSDVTVEACADPPRKSCSAAGDLPFVLIIRKECFRLGLRVCLLGTSRSIRTKGSLSLPASRIKTLLCNAYGYFNLGCLHALTSLSTSAPISVTHSRGCCNSSTSSRLKGPKMPRTTPMVGQSWPFQRECQQGSGLSC